MENEQRACTLVVVVIVVVVLKEVAVIVVVVAIAASAAHAFFPAVESIAPILSLHERASQNCLVFTT